MDAETLYSAAMSQSNPQNATPDAANQLLEAARLDRNLDMVAWGLIFLWLGIYWFTELGFTWCMVGIGAILLGESALRMMMNLKPSFMAMLLGVLFLGGGFWHMAQAPWALVPVLFVIFGVAMVARAIASAVRHRR